MHLRTGFPYSLTFLSQLVSVSDIKFILVNRYFVSHNHVGDLFSFDSKELLELMAPLNTTDTLFFFL